MDILVVCPNCEGLVEILQINCGIFRHGIFKETGEQINPHASKEYCDDIVAKDLIYGCGKPFQLVMDVNESVYKTMLCEYV